ncbi:hypothetical protein COO16_04255 [Bacillus pseudomycoides]|uniref:hypothetical protein n=1 Tax=Bacillus pseudomycoides TaxID=64104 RepID=UPI000BEDB15B|nr:hypothetical protein [Bacillus pseudomycoides]PDY14181.1 hypothetical protein COO16_04255 [Bacillus pseudomycoides]
MGFLLIIVLIIVLCLAFILLFIKYKKKVRYDNSEGFEKKEIQFENFNNKQIKKSPVYVIDHSKNYPNKYAKGDREMIKRMFNQISNQVSNHCNNKDVSSSNSSYNGYDVSLELALGIDDIPLSNDNSNPTSNSSITCDE